jgi:hypothetical protein
MCIKAKTADGELYYRGLPKLGLCGWQISIKQHDWGYRVLWNGWKGLVCQGRVCSRGSPGSWGGILLLSINT